jgi:hypothetical protein
LTLFQMSRIVCDELLYFGGPDASLDTTLTLRRAHEALKIFGNLEVWEGS